MNKKKIIVFDLDGTLAESKSPLDDETANLLSELLNKKMVAIISGGGFPQFENQVIGRLPKNSAFGNLYVFPTKGGAMFRFENKKWTPVYEEVLSAADKEKIRAAFDAVLPKVDFIPKESWGEKLEDRGAQFTFSALGQNAPIEAKKEWDPDFKKRLTLKKELDKYLPEFSVEVGGSTSIDITKKDVDKAFAIGRILEILKLKKEDVLFIGDAIYPGGNDYPVLETGVETIKVKDYVETKDIIRSFLD